MVNGLVAMVGGGGNGRRADASRGEFAFGSGKVPGRGVGFRPPGRQESDHTMLLEDVS